MYEGNSTLAVALLVVGLIIGAGAGYLMTPTGTYDDMNDISGDGIPNNTQDTSAGIDWTLWTLFIINSILTINNWALGTRAMQKIRRLRDNR